MKDWQKKVSRAWSNGERRLAVLVKLSGITDSTTVRKFLVGSVAKDAEIIRGFHMGLSEKNIKAVLGPNGLPQVTIYNRRLPPDWRVGDRLTTEIVGDTVVIRRVNA